MKQKTALRKKKAIMPENATNECITTKNRNFENGKAIMRKNTTNDGNRASSIFLSLQTGRVEAGKRQGQQPFHVLVSVSES